jgi:hypothetical protein
MRVYVVSVIIAFTSSTHVREVFVDEQDAKTYMAQAKVDGGHDDQYKIDPRELRTAWRG